MFGELAWSYMYFSYSIQRMGSSVCSTDIFSVLKIIFTNIYAALYRLETVAVTKKQEAELEVTEMKMLRFELGIIKMDRIRYSLIHSSLHEARLRWYGHVKRSDGTWNTLDKRS